MTVPSMGWSDFALKRHVRGTGLSYSVLTSEQVLNLVRLNWQFRDPGEGETGLDRKVLVSIPIRVVRTNGEILSESLENLYRGIPLGVDLFYCPPKVPLVEGMPVRAEVVCRQKGEDPVVEVFITPEDAEKFGYVETPAGKVDIVLYSAEALLENGGERTTDAEWEVVCLLCEPGEALKDKTPMHPTTMARNFLQLAGGTKSKYTPKQFAVAIVHHAMKAGVKIRRPNACSSD